MRDVTLSPSSHSALRDMHEEEEADDFMAPPPPPRPRWGKKAAGSSAAGLYMMVQVLRDQIDSIFQSDRLVRANVAL